MSYKDVASVLNDSEKKITSIKSLVFNRRCKNPKKLFALSHETLKYKPILDEILQKTKVKTLKGNCWLHRVLLFEFLFGKGIQEQKYKTVFASCQSSLKAELARLKVKAKVSSNEDLLSTYQTATGEPLQTWRYVRVNTLKASSVSEVIEEFKQTFTFVSCAGMTYESYVVRVRGLQRSEFTQDITLPDLLVFAAGSSLHKHRLYTQGKIILQDKASCLPAYVLSTMPLNPGLHCIDCCAAPGNKTSHLAAVLNNTGKIFAFDKDSTRVASMKKLLTTAGATCVHVTQGDFLKVKPSVPQYSKVKAVIVDPSCSGSGIVSRLSHLTDGGQGCSRERLEKLSAFQKQILSHALSFPAVQWAVYSTCSLHEEENEEVVRETLARWWKQFELVHILPSIPHRGLAKFGDIGDKCVRLSPQKDCTNGFFVACFRRKNAGGEGNGQTGAEITSENEIEEIYQAKMEEVTGQAKAEVSSLVEIEKTRQGKIKLMCQDKTEVSSQEEIKATGKGKIKIASEDRTGILSQKKNELTSQAKIKVTSEDKIEVTRGEETRDLNMDTSGGVKKHRRKLEKRENKASSNSQEDENESNCIKNVPNQQDVVINGKKGQKRKLDRLKESLTSETKVQEITNQKKRKKKKKDLTSSGYIGKSDTGYITVASTNSNKGVKKRKKKRQKVHGVRKAVTVK